MYLKFYDGVDSSSANEVVISRHNGEELALCRVCGDKSSGFHYGALSCDGCKGFFRRSVLIRKKYSLCKKEHGCFVNRINRNKCQYCRFQRCLEVGMSYKAVRFGKYTKKKTCKTICPVVEEDNSLSVVDLHLRSKHVICTVYEAYMKASESLESFVRKHTSQSIVVENKTDVSCVYLRYLTAIIRFLTSFATEIPIFNSLDKESQVQLIKDSLIETAIVTNALQLRLTASDYFNSKLNIYIPKEKTRMMGHFGQMLVCMQEAMTRLDKLNLTSIESAMLSGLVLFCPDRDGVVDKHTLGIIETDLSLALRSLISSRFGEENVLFAKVIELITELRTISTNFQEEIFNSKWIPSDDEIVC